MIKNNADEFLRDEKIRVFLIKEGVDDINTISINSSFIKRFKAE